MNSFVLMAKIVRSPQLRYTQDNQLAVTEMMVQFDNLSPNAPPSTLKVVGWGSLATEMNDKYTEGDEVILSGRLKMDTIDRQEGFKEKRAELTVSSIHPFHSSAHNSSKTNNAVADKVVKIDSYKSSSHDDSDSISDDDYPSDSSANDQNPDNIPF